MNPKPLLLACILLAFTLALSVQVSRSDGEAWLDGWLFRKSHIIANATGAGTDYQVNITAHYGAGSDSGNTVYLNSHCETDFADIRFTDNDGDTLLDYWMETYFVSDNATFWVEVADSLESSSVLMYIYYGNNTVASTSNIFTTFPFADDFEDDVIGDWWTQVGAPTESGGILTIEGNRVYSASTVIVGHKLRTLAQMESVVSSIQIGTNDLGGSTERIYFWAITGNNNLTHTRDAGASDDQDIAFNTNWNRYQYNWEVTDQFVTFSINDALINTHTTRVPDDAMIVRLLSATNNPKAHFAWLFVAKYVSPEPVHGIWGIEEAEVIVSYLTYYHTGGGIIRVDNVTMTNGTEEYHVNNTLIEFEIVAIVEGNLTFGFDNFTWASSYNYSNPYNFSLIVTGNTTLWAYFVPLEEGGVLPSVLFTGAAIVTGTVLFILFLVWDKKRR